MDQHIKLLLDKESIKGSIIFYPSSCGYSDEFQEVPYDNVILNSNVHRESFKKGKVYCLKCDNNEILGEFIKRGIKISTLVVINDGCREGGNYECAARSGYLGRYMAVTDDVFLFVTNHLKEKPHLPINFKEIKPPQFLDIFLKYSNHVRESMCWEGELITDTVKYYTLGRVRIKVVWDSIWRHYRDYQIVFISRTHGSQQATEHFLKYYPWDGSARLKWYIDELPVDSIQQYLHEAARVNAEKIAFIPFAQGKYSRVIEEISNWSCDFPKEIGFFHLHYNDYRSIRRYCQNQVSNI